MEIGADLTEPEQAVVLALGKENFASGAKVKKMKCFVCCTRSSVAKIDKKSLFQKRSAARAINTAGLLACSKHQGRQDTV